MWYRVWAEARGRKNDYARMGRTCAPTSSKVHRTARPLPRGPTSLTKSGQLLPIYSHTHMDLLFGPDEEKLGLRHAAFAGAAFYA